MKTKMSKKNEANICPECGKIGKPQPLTRKVDKRKKTVEITFICSNGHEFTVKQPLATK